MRLAGIAVATGLWLLVVTTSALAASPSPAPVSGDPRSSGQGPGLVGDPGFALIAVVLIGVGSLLATALYVRLTARRGA